MHASLLLAIAATGLAGCATSPGLSPTSLAGTYACRPQSEHATEPVAHLVTITPDSRTKLIRAAVDAGRAQTLALVNGGEPSLFASNRFAWRPRANAGTLTDVGTVQTFDCAREMSTSASLAPGDAGLAIPRRPVPLPDRSYGRG